MRDTAELRKKMLALWARFDKGEISGTEARAHIGFARTVLETMKVEIAAAHLSHAVIPSVPIMKQIDGKKNAARGSVQ